MPGRVRIVVVDRQPIFRQGMVMALNQERELCVIGIGSTRAEALRLATLLRPDVLILDMTLLDASADDWSVAEAMRLAVPEMKIIFLTPVPDVKQVMAALKLGVPGYVLKSVSDQQFRRIVREIHAGALHINPERTALRLANDDDNGGTVGTTHVEFTPREEQVLSLLQFGLTNVEIARILGLTSKIVTHCVSVLLRKLKVKTRTQAVLAQQASKPRLVN